VRLVLLINEEEEDEKIQIQMASFLSFLFFFSLADVEEKSYRAEHSLMSFVNFLSPSLSLYTFFSFYLALPFLLIERRVLIPFRKKKPNRRPRLAHTFPGERTLLDVI
jgi:hypothetical protein